MNPNMNQAMNYLQSYMSAMGMPGAQMPMQPTMPGITPPMRHADIIQVPSEAEVDSYPQQAGTSQMYMTADDRCIIIKTMGNNGVEKTYYDQRPPAPPAPDPAQYVTREELRGLIAEAVAGLTGGGEHEPV